MMEGEVQEEWEKLERRIKNVVERVESEREGGKKGRKGWVERGVQGSDERGEEKFERVEEKQGTRTGV